MTEAYDDGYEDITGVDIVPEVLDTMRQLNASKRPGIKYQLAVAWLQYVLLLKNPGCNERLP